MKIFNLVFCILFILFAALQYNDPDPYIWVPVYGYAAVLCWLAFRGRYFPKAYLLGIVAYVGYAVYLFFEKDGVYDWLTVHDASNIAGSMKAESPWVEDAREFFGLLILVAVLAGDWWYARRRRK
jgi:hypothetical protein